MDLGCGFLSYDIITTQESTIQTFTTIKSLKYDVKKYCNIYVVKVWKVNYGRVLN
jgi:hypothetical protein